MNHQTVRDKIYCLLLTLEPAKPFPYRRLKGAGSESSTKRAIRQLCEEGHLLRVMTGFYVRPKKHKLLPNITITCSPENLTKAWAKERGYILTTTSFEEAYRLRFQTQAPVQTEYWTNGPSRTFTVGNAIASTRHVPDNLLLWHDLPVGRLYRALQSLSVEHTKPRELQKALSILYSTEKEISQALLQMEQNESFQKWLSILNKV
ncbi:DUF6088 family protein [Agaribacterium haliotis]|uniref:DUF6088 family protein n=1 Tax=Agaribacterium haliotis TaxID=2013869 RepID=UPI000BB58C84|nr:DUF6088 family protein [Agaribacterium haliotis]